ncbi:MAG: DUF1573 domain-containing protein [Pirellulaceae bacterium]|nr:DUF1573 domain-containing protein [Pirellulaceae bacterium]
MRSYLTAAMVIAVAGQLSAAQVSSMFRTTSHDFGTVARAAKTEFRFEFENPYPQAIHVRSVRTSCGCTTPIIETETVEPGGRGSILARFNTGTHTGARSATVTVSFDRPHFSEIQLHVKGYIRSDVVFNPGEVAFGTIREGTESTASVDVDYAGRSDWKIADVISQDSFISVKSDEISRSGGRIKYRLTVTTNSAAPSGLFQSEVIVQTNDRNLTRIPIKVNANIQADVAVTPQMMALGDIQPGDSVRQVVIVRGFQPFLIVDIKSSEFDVRYDPTTEAKPLHTLPLTLSPKNGSGEVKGKIFVKTNLPGDQVVEVGAVYNVPVTP